MRDEERERERGDSLREMAIKKRGSNEERVEEREGASDKVRYSDEER